MLAWIRNLLTRPAARTVPPTRPALGFEPLEAREVPALLGLGTHTVLGLVNTTVAATLNASVSLAGPAINLTGGIQVSGTQSQEPSTPPATGTASVSGVVRYSMAGGDSVGPVAGAAVTLTDAAGHVVASTTTAADGSYSLGSLPAGSYTLSVSSDTYGADSQSLTLADGQSANANFTLAT
jgi:hypothetical protein